VAALAEPSSDPSPQTGMRHGVSRCQRTLQTLIGISHPGVCEARRLSLPGSTFGPRMSRRPAVAAPSLGKRASGCARSRLALGTRSERVDRRSAHARFRQQLRKRGHLRPSRTLVVRAGVSGREAATLARRANEQTVSDRLRAVFDAQLESGAPDPVVSASWSVTSRKMSSHLWFSTPQSLPVRTMTASASGAT
jgi:hypothetical protein